MSDDCEDRLLEIQYFIARDWSLDPKLVMACDTDAKMLCGSQTKWWERDPKKEGPHPGHVVLSCLYRHAVEDPLLKLEQEAGAHRPPGFAGPAKEMLGQTVSCEFEFSQKFDPMQITQRCAIEMHRVMRERAGRVSLQPDIEENCRSLLAEHCSQDTRVWPLMMFLGRKLKFIFRVVPS
jgi:Golgi apparatus protein 1